MEKLRGRRIGKIEMEIAIRHPSVMEPLSFRHGDLCTAIDTHKYTGAHLYIRPTLDDATNDSAATDSSQPELQTLLKAIQISAIKYGHAVRSNGKPTKNRNSTKDPVEMIIVCQCSRRYDGKRFNRENAQVEIRQDYRASHYRNDRRNNRPGEAGRRGSQRTMTNRSFGSRSQCCPFNIKIHSDASGYYVNPSYRYCYHQHNLKRDHLRIPTRLIGAGAWKIMNDMKS